MLLRIVLGAFILVMIVGGCIRNAAERTGAKLYTVRCSGCGSVFESTSPAPIDICPNCPLDLCPETGYLVLELGGLNELVRANPENQEYARQMNEVMRRLDEHCKTCEKCRLGLGVKPNAK